MPKRNSNRPPKSEIVLKLNPEAIDVAQETAPAEPRFVIFGSRISGAYGAATDFEKYLAAHGFKDAQVDAVRDAASINDAFYNTHSEDTSHELPAPERAGVWHRLGRTLLRREVQEEAGKDLPQGVVVFPEMRQYMPNGNGVFVPSPREYIQDLCDQNGVPVIFMEDVHSGAEFNDALSGFELEAAGKFSGDHHVYTAYDNMHWRVVNPKE